MKRDVMIKMFFGGIISLLFGGLSVSKPADNLLRPPGALDEAAFLSTCLRCGKCSQVCPQKAIKIAKGEMGLAIGTPYIVPRDAACDLCMDCTKVCTSGALRLIDKENVRMGTAVINEETCLAWQGDECKVCYTCCPFYNQAIKLKEHKRPVIDKQICVGCGICEHVCIAEPAAVTVRR